MQVSPIDRGSYEGSGEQVTGIGRYRTEVFRVKARRDWLMNDVAGTRDTEALCSAIPREERCNRLGSVVPRSPKGIDDGERRIRSSCF